MRPSVICSCLWSATLSYLTVCIWWPISPEWCRPLEHPGIFLASRRTHAGIPLSSTHNFFSYFFKIRREGTLDFKFHWYLRFYNCISLLVCELKVWWQIFSSTVGAFFVDQFFVHCPIPKGHCDLCLIFPSNHVRVTLFTTI